MDEQPKVIARCPGCGSDRIEEENEGTIMYPVRRWVRDEDGTIIPDDYGEPDVDPDLVTTIESDPYHCTACDWQGSAEDLVVEEGPHA